MGRSLLLIVLLGGILGACSSSVPGTRSDLMDPDGLSAMLKTGVGVAPVAATNVITGSADAAALFSDELDAALRNSFPGTPVTSSDDVYVRMEEAGNDSHARLRSLRRRLIRELELDARELASISGDVGERFLLVVFVDERTVDGVQRTELDDYRAFSYYMATHGQPTGELRGEAMGFLLDLESAKRVWKAHVEYQSENLTATEGDADRIIKEARADAAIRLTEALALARRQG